MSCITVNIKRLDPTVELPKYAHPTDAGLDLRSNEDCVLKPFERRLVSTGLAIALPEFQDVPPAVETAPNTALDEAPTVTTELKPGRGRRKGQARRRG